MVLAFAPIAGHHIVTWIVIGLIAGLVAAKVVDGRGQGFLRDTMIGILGAILGGFLLHAVQGGAHASTNVFVEAVVAFAGAVILLFIEKSLRHRSGRLTRRGGRRRGIRI